jgi:peptidoglycan/xylan/chitin deacetylase (PgdA/CDA1 family)
MDVLDAHGMKAVFFVESLFPCVLGPERLREIVQMVQERGHEVQVHLHTE